MRLSMNMQVNEGVEGKTMIVEYLRKAACSKNSVNNKGVAFINTLIS